MKNPVIALALLVLVLLPFPVSAEYMPSGGLLEFFTSLAEKEPMKDYGPVMLKQIQVGETYEVGEVAYFAITDSGEFFLHLEEWTLGEDGNFFVSFWSLKNNSVTHWARILSPKGAPIGDFPKFIIMKTDDPVCIAKSERAQELLKNFGRRI
ncbi:MAG: hypothetical protein A3H69_02965 [Candidatus Sungbacteria bacterium RIFCSPLOWO2_02_FULL_47_9]|uniref:Uncharacterized protein n=1 Tax=Candidatus Sungbacteria bacterium RIFCSPHIGHO2_01_FULL_47_32 TaxID=1802264 RepID=A0A1G2K7Z6_9BACT|nr:MAG: hypothetical protein A2633_06550 [Candidatus Sungbacteria bacterium RIFCSPHIGHO2_01_FULL_47_32]OGZ99284.1 MAG: hypothetical protein A3D57_05475 [Candidatus Sungbacteria bacterium RIFCSPHIGHO2_02_FULL_46_12]OHA06335.1 MAG: hypothetical protein A3A28_04690 [Candidatus Sungbacteria bacterium RIFCSPLOWO2_01_FULL_47_32]OHA11342.1 MAG: hypothetical protein A3H69_02965 [Candidatus Sungbacteria bacterium RIFCSPLOWO2_02_FULL_47_9]